LRLVPKLEVIDIVGVSTRTFTDAYRNAVEQVRGRATSIESIHIAPPFEVVIRDDNELEFRTVVRIIYRPD
jgi:hypothetical protein